LIVSRIMRSLLFALLFAILCAVLATEAGFAQDDPPLTGPISILEAGDFRALAVTTDGSRLLVADAENNQVRVYDFANPEAPERLTSIDLSGTPMLLTGGAGFGLVAVTTDEETDAVEVVVPPSPGERYPATTGSYIPIDKNPRALALSPDNHWGIAISDASYTLLEINAPDNVDSIPVNTRTTWISAALSNTNAYFLRANSLESAPLDALAALEAAQTLPFEGTPSALALNADATAGVIVVDDNRLIFFDAQTLEQTSEFMVEGSAISSIHFITNDEGETLLITQEESGTVGTLNPANPQPLQALTAEAADGRPVQALATFGEYLIVTDGVTISIYSA
jgi:hypothetical protein